MISWGEDEAADEYQLYRAKDDIDPVYNLIYKGTQTTYQDNFSIAEEGSRYLYRLSKRRGKALFEDMSTRGKTAMGIVHGNRQDAHEPNGSMGQATVLGTTKLEANIWLYGSNTEDNIIISDEDWYCIEIPANWKAGIKLVELATGGGGHFYMEVLGSYTKALISNNTEQLVNNDNQTRWYYFRIYPNFLVFRLESQNLLTGGYGAFIPYTLEIVYLQPN
jgi:hypothetical protein